MGVPKEASYKTGKIYYIFFVSDKTGKISPITWQSKRIRPVVQSTMAAEILAFVDAVKASLSYLLR